MADINVPRWHRHHHHHRHRHRRLASPSNSPTGTERSPWKLRDRRFAVAKRSAGRRALDFVKMEDQTMRYFFSTRTIS